MTSIDTFILSCFDMLMCILIINAIAEVRLSKTKRTVLFVILGSFLIALGDNYFSTSVFSHIISFVTLFTWLTIYSYKFFKSAKSLITAFIFTVVILFIIQITSLVIVHTVIGDVEYIFKYGLISQVLGLGILYIFIRFTSLNVIYSYIDQKNKWIQVLLVNMFIIIIVILTLWNLNIEWILQSLLLISVVCLFMLFVNIFLLKDGLINKENEDTLAVYETYLPIINSIIEEVKVKQHDYHNQLQTIKHLKEQLNSEGSEYIDDLIKPDIWSNLILLENKVLMAFLYSKYSYAKLKDIDIEYDISNFLVNSKYTDYELIEIFGILMDNAIEATEDVASECKKITVEISWENNSNVFKIINPVVNFSESDIQKMFSGKNSTKGEDRGIGLTKLRALLKKYKGNLSAHYDSDNKLIEVKINYL